MKDARLHKDSLSLEYGRKHVFINENKLFIPEGSLQLLDFRAEVGFKNAVSAMCY